MKKHTKSIRINTDGKKALTVQIIICALALLSSTLLSYLELLDSVEIGIFLLIAGAAVLFYHLRFNPPEILDKGERIVTIVMTFVFCLQLHIWQAFRVFSKSLGSGSKLGALAGNVSLAPLAYIGAAVFILGVFVSVYNIVELAFGFVLSGDREKKTDWKFYYLLIAVVTFVCVASTYPGIFLELDNKSIWDSVSSGKWSDWHTVAFTRYVSFCRKIFDSMYSVNLFNTVIWLVVNYYILYSVFYKAGKYRAIRIYSIVLILVLSPFIYLEVMFKDTIFSIAMLGLTAYLYKEVTQKTSWKDLLFAVFCSSYFMCCRHGGAAIACVSILAVIIFHIVRHKSFKIPAVLLAAQIIVYILAEPFTIAVTGAEKNPAYVKYSTPLAMIGAAAEAGASFRDEDLEAITEVMPVEEWVECYNPYVADTISRVWGTIGDKIYIVQDKIDNEDFGKRIINTNAHILIDHPFLYLSSLFRMNSIIWEVGNPIRDVLMSVCNCSEDGNISYTGFYNLTSGISKFMSGFSVTRAYAWRGGVSLFLLIFMAVILIVKKKGLWLFAFVPVMLNEAMLILTVPAQHSRYVLPAIEISIFLLANFANETFSKNPKKKEKPVRSKKVKDS